MTQLRLSDSFRVRSPGQSFVGLPVIFAKSFVQICYESKKQWHSKVAYLKTLVLHNCCLIPVFFFFLSSFRRGVGWCSLLLFAPLVHQGFGPDGNVLSWFWLEFVIQETKGFNSGRSLNTSSSPLHQASRFCVTRCPFVGFHETSTVCYILLTNCPQCVFGDPHLFWCFLAHLRVFLLKSTQQAQRSSS